MQRWLKMRNDQKVKETVRSVITYLLCWLGIRAGLSLILLSSGVLRLRDMYTADLIIIQPRRMRRVFAGLNLGVVGCIVTVVVSILVG